MLVQSIRFNDSKLALVLENGEVVEIPILIGNGQLLIDWDSGEIKKIKLEFSPGVKALYK